MKPETETRDSELPQLTVSVLLPETFSHSLHRGTQNDGTPIDYIKVQPSRPLAQCNFLMALFPQKNAHAALPDAKALTGDGFAGAQIRLLHANDLLLFRTGQKPLSVNGVESDAQVLFVRRQGDRATRFSIQNGSRLQVAGAARLIASQKLNAALDYSRVGINGRVQAKQALQLALHCSRRPTELRIDAEPASTPRYDEVRKQVLLHIPEGEHEVTIGINRKATLP